MPMNPRLLRPTSSSLDPDAAVYLNAVAAADGQQLEPAVKKAIDNFVRGCKADGIWSAIKASCILAGARTLSGALTPLVGTAPTNNGPFVSGDYDRKTGLVGNGTSKYLNSNRNNDADPQDSKHLAVYRTATNATLGGLIANNTSASGASWLFAHTTPNLNTARINSASSITAQTFGATGFVGASRADGTDVDLQYNGVSSSVSAASASPSSQNLDVFRGPTNQYTDSRIAFYSIGESLDLALLDSRVSGLVTAIGNAIP